MSIFTPLDESRYHQLLLKYPNLTNLERQIEDQIRSTQGENNNFTIFTNNDWESRQFAHLIAAKHGWYSKKIMSEYNFGSHSGKCSECHYLVVGSPPTNDQLWEMTYCCDFCHGICPNGCQDGYTKSSGKVWLGEINFSKTPIKSGRKSRRRRNRWKYCSPPTK